MGRRLVEKRRLTSAESSFATTPASLLTQSACQRARVTPPCRPTVHIVVSSASENHGRPSREWNPEITAAMFERHKPPTASLTNTGPRGWHESRDSTPRGVTSLHGAFARFARHWAGPHPANGRERANFNFLS